MVSFTQISLLVAITLSALVISCFLFNECIASNLAFELSTCGEVAGDFFCGCNRLTFDLTCYSQILQQAFCETNPNFASLFETASNEAIDCRAGAGARNATLDALWEERGVEIAAVAEASLNALWNSLSSATPTATATPTPTSWANKISGAGFWIILNNSGLCLNKSANFFKTSISQM
jgi:hypothetical protein